MEICVKEPVVWPGNYVLVSFFLRNKEKGRNFANDMYGMAYCGRKVCLFGELLQLRKGAVCHAYCLCCQCSCVIPVVVLRLEIVGRIEI